MCGPHPLSGQSEDGFGDSVAVLLCEGDDGGGHAGVEQEGHQVVGRASQDRADGPLEGQELGQRVVPIAYNFSLGRGEGGTGAGQEVEGVPGGHAAPRQPAGAGLVRGPPPTEPVRPVSPAEEPGLDGGGPDSR